MVNKSQVPKTQAENKKTEVKPHEAPVENHIEQKNEKQ